MVTVLVTSSCWGKVDMKPQTNGDELAMIVGCMLVCFLFFVSTFDIHVSYCFTITAVYILIYDICSNSILHNMIF